MRLPTRVAATLLLAVSAVTCTDAPTGTSRAPRAVLSLVPRFSSSAGATFDALSDAGLEVDRVRILLVRAPADTVRDTTIVFPAGATSMNVELSIPVAPGTVLSARLDFRAGDIVLFSGSGPVTAQAPNVPSAAAPAAVNVVWVGPGATATRVALTPHGGTFSSTAPLTIAAQVFDAAGTLLTGVPMVWASSDATVATVSGGVLSFTGKRGVTTVSATTTPGGIADQAAFTFVPPAAQIVVVSGGGQTGTAGTTLPQPLVVAVQAADGAGVAGQSVTFTAINGSIAPASAVTDANGRAQATMTLGPTAGTATFTARSGTLAASASATVTSSQPATVTISPAGGTLTALGDQLSLAATVRDGGGNVMTVAPAWVSRAPGIATVDTAGSVRAIANGTAYVVATAGNAKDSVAIVVRQAVDTLFMSRDTLKLAVGDTATLVATALDRNKRVIADAVPAFASANTNIATVSSAGLVRLVSAGTTVVTATAGGRSASTVVTQGQPGTGGITAAFAYLRITPGGGDVRVGTTQTLVAQYVDASGNATTVSPQWASSQPGRGPVTSGGVFTATDTGAVQITATLNGVVGHADFRLLPAPTLTSFTFAPTTLNGVSTSPVMFSVTIGANDAGAGIAAASVTFTAPGDVATATCSAAAPTSGTARRGMWDCTITLPAGSPTGIWRATSVVLAGSITRSYGATSLASFGSTTLTVNP